MAMTFDATLKDMGRDSPVGFLTAFDRPPTLPVKLLNVDLSTVTTAADLILGLGEPLVEIVHIDFQSSAAAWKHADLNGIIRYAPRPQRGSMDFSYEIVRLWERPAEELLAADLGVAPLAMLGRLPDDLSLEDGLASVA